MKKSLFILAGLVVFASSCAWTPQTVTLRPEIQTTLESVGQGRAILLTVVDERPRTTVGTRAVKGMGAEITVQGDLTNIVRTALSDGLQRQGFVVTSEKPADGRELRVEIRNLDYGVTMGFWAGSLRTECSLKAICIIGSKRPYEQLYRGEHQESVQVVQGAEANEGYLNSALSNAINSLLQDPRLSQALAKQS
jgi:uncharacterized lipoprotein